MYANVQIPDYEKWPLHIQERWIKENFELYKFDQIQKTMAFWKAEGTPCTLADAERWFNIDHNIDF